MRLFPNSHRGPVPSAYGTVFRATENRGTAARIHRNGVQELYTDVRAVALKRPSEVVAISGPRQK